MRKEEVKRKREKKREKERKGEKGREKEKERKKKGNGVSAFRIARRKPPGPASCIFVLLASIFILSVRTGL